MPGKVAAKLKDAASRVETDLRNEKINYKVREHSLAKVPVILVCGKREAEEGTVNIRRLGLAGPAVDRSTRRSRRFDEATPPDIKRKRWKKRP